jgi:hypothetical protein
MAPLAMEMVRGIPKTRVGMRATTVPAPYS